MTDPLLICAPMRIEVRAIRRGLRSSASSAETLRTGSVPEVLRTGWGTTRAALARYGNPVLRQRDGGPVRTDAGNLIYDLAAGAIEAPGALDRALHDIPGVVETGRFVGRADVVLVAGDSGVRRLVRG